VAFTIAGELLSRLIYAAWQNRGVGGPSRRVRPKKHLSLFMKRANLCWGEERFCLIR
jgi:hypothetical protein